jgi:hypothetical protein
MARIDGYGMRVFRNGIDFRSDRRKRLRPKAFRHIIDEVRRRAPGYRGEIKAFSRASQRRLAFVFANVGTRFRSLVTLTYHAVAESWEDNGKRNRRIVSRSKRDLNRFLTAMRPQLGAYLWVQEFQARGVVHYHLIAECELSEPEVRLVWCRAIDALDDAAARTYAAKVDGIQNEAQVRKYLGHYVGKLRQKLLPVGVSGAGRWWGASRSIQLVVLGELVSCPLKGRSAKEPETRTVRCLRKFISRIVGFDFKGGVLIDWRGETCQRVARAMSELVRLYGESDCVEAVLGEQGWERIESHD